MTEPSLEFVSRQLERVLDQLRIMQRDVDMLTRLILRLDSTVDALRAGHQIAVAKPGRFAPPH